MTVTFRVPTTFAPAFSTTTAAPGMATEGFSDLGLALDNYEGTSDIADSDEFIALTLGGNFVSGARLDPAGDMVARAREFAEELSNAGRFLAVVGLGAAEGATGAGAGAGVVQAIARGAVGASGLLADAVRRGGKKQVAVSSPPVKTKGDADKLTNEGDKLVELANSIEEANPPAAVEIYKKAASLFSQAAFIFHGLKLYAESAMANQKAAKGYEKYMKDEDPGVITESYRLEAEAWELAAEQNKEDNAISATYSANAGIAWINAEQYREAEKNFRDAEAKYIDDFYSIGGMRTSQGSALALHKKRRLSAEAYEMAAKAYARTKNNWIECATAWLRSGEQWIQARNYKNAIRAFEFALETAKKANLPENSNVAGDARRKLKEAKKK